MLGFFTRKFPQAFKLSCLLQHSTCLRSETLQPRGSVSEHMLRAPLRCVPRCHNKLTALPSKTCPEKEVTQFHCAVARQPLLHAARCETCLSAACRVRVCHPNSRGSESFHQGGFAPKWDKNKQGLAADATAQLSYPHCWAQREPWKIRPTTLQQQQDMQTVWGWAWAWVQQLLHADIAVSSPAGSLSLTLPVALLKEQHLDLGPPQHSGSHDQPGAEQDQLHRCHFLCVWMVTDVSLFYLHVLFP